MLTPGASAKARRPFFRPVSIFGHRHAVHARVLGQWVAPVALAQYGRVPFHVTSCLPDILTSRSPVRVLMVQQHECTVIDGAYECTEMSSGAQTPTFPVEVFLMPKGRPLLVCRGRLVPKQLHLPRHHSRFERLSDDRAGGDSADAAGIYQPLRGQSPRLHSE